jgi:hypothetical protein
MMPLLLLKINIDISGNQCNAASLHHFHALAAAAAIAILRCRVSIACCSIS